MKILVVGASRGTGKAVVYAGIKRGHRVAAFARQPELLNGLEHPGLQRIAGDVFNDSDVSKAVMGQHAVIVALGASASLLKPIDLYSEGTEAVIEAMKQHGVKRLVVLSACGSSESSVTFNPLTRFLMRDVFLKHNYEDHDRQETITRASGLDWVIARPTRLTNGSAMGKYKKEVGLAKVPSHIARADVADFMLDAVESDKWLHQAVLLGG